MDETVRKATRQDVDGLVLSLSRAFDDDPVVNWILRQDSRRTQGFELFFRTSLELLCLKHKGVFTTQTRSGGALWYPPGTASIGFLQQLMLLPRMVAGATLRGLPRFVGVMDKMEKHKPKADHYYLQFLGVDPDHQRQGYGAALMKPVLEQCDRDGLGAYLEATKESNVQFYTRFGFEITEHLPLGEGAPSMWLMWRDAQ